MKFAYLTAIVSFACLTAVSASACIIIPDERSNWTKKVMSKPVEVKDDCSFINGGYHDRISGGEAIDLGGFRVAQYVSSSKHRVMLSQCNTRETMLLFGKVVDIQETSCGPQMSWSDPMAADALVPVTFGDTLAELDAEAAAQKLGTALPSMSLNSYSWGERVWPRDYIDPLCGCKIFYPDSIGATQ